MTWEVEQKFILDDPNALIDNLRHLGFALVAIEHHDDTYFRHPCRDFKKTSEAFRIRQIDGKACVTYKGPRHANDEVKARQEIELMIQSTQATDWHSMLERLGFRPLPPVRKRRQVFKNQISQYASFSVTIDSVDGLGEFAEVEALVTDEASLANAKLAVVELAKQLGLDRLQHRSYLSQMLEKQGEDF